MYGAFADLYDRLMDDFDYPGWAEHYLRLLRAAGCDLETVCECGCGTGSISVELAARGIRVTGVDLSAEMLRVAADKARRAGVKIPFICQDMRKIILPRPVDAVISACDGVNYLTDEKSVRAFFRAARAAIKPGGALAFDISSRSKIERQAKDALFFEDRDDVTYLWQNTYERDARLIFMSLAFFVRREGGLYQRIDEEQVQRAHEVEELSAWLAAEGFDSIKTYGGFEERPPRAEDARIHFTAVRP